MVNDAHTFLYPPLDVTLMPFKDVNAEIETKEDYIRPRMTHMNMDHSQSTGGPRKARGVKLRWSQQQSYGQQGVSIIEPKEALHESLIIGQNKNAPQAKPED